MKLLQLIILISLIVLDLKGQCPDGTWNFVPQERVTVTFDNQMTCEYDISYCWKEIPGIPSILLIELYSWSCVDINCCPQDISTSLIYRKCGESLVTNNPGNRPWTIPPCDYVVAENFQLSWGACYSGDRFAMNMAGQSVYQDIGYVNTMDLFNCKLCLVILRCRILLAPRVAHHDVISEIN